MYEIINNYHEKIDIKNLNQLVDNIVKRFSLEEALFNIILVDNEYIHKLNKEYRNIDRETDVITFALEDNMDIQPEIRILGDIYISIDKAKSQAIEYGHSFKRELSFLIVHGILHLLGYDHQNKEDEKIMFELQDKILEEANIRRDLWEVVL